MAGSDPNYQRVPLLPLSSKDPSDPTVGADEPIVKAARDPRPRLGGAGSPRLRFLGVTAVGLLWLVSIKVSWQLGWRNAEDAVYTKIYSDNSTAPEPKVPSAWPPVAHHPSANHSALADLVDFDIEGPADFSGLAEVCNSTKWVAQRWFTCDRMEGGLGNVRNELLTCLRYAIDAGAGFVLPSLRIRGQLAVGEEELHTGGRAGMGFYFDVDYFKETMAEFCPQMAIADTVYDVPSFGSAAFPELKRFKDVYTLATGRANDPDGLWPNFLNTNATFFRPDMDKVYPADLTAKTPVIHRFELSYFEWSTTNDPVLFWHNFGRLARFPPAVLELASEVFRNLVGPDTAPFFGCHLRIEGDVGEAWGAFDDLARDYVNLLLQRPLALVYLAGGDASGLPRFRAFLAKQHSRTRHVVQTKSTLLSEESLARLEAMPFDQQAQVDYLVLLKSEFHVGTGASSFTANLGARRHLLTDRKDELFIHYEDDGRTYLRNAGSATFMRLAMWP